ncbi:MAG: metallophosphoesterase family protein [Eubacteriales bacterium]
MIYICSDIHGQHEKYLQIFEKVNLSPKDTLFILGDVIDRGEGGIDILLDMMYRFNVIPLMGNHEFMALNILKKLQEEITEDTLSGFDDEFMTSMMTWFENGGTSTLEAFKKQSNEDRQAIVEFLEEFELFDEVEVNGQDYVLVHAGLDNFTADRQLSDYALHELIWTRADYSRKYFENKILITGHTPVSEILGDPSANKIYHNQNHIAIDCGCGFGENLGVLCLDTMEEFYV